MGDSIYLDYQATTPLAPEVYDIMLPWLKTGFANPHSAHKLGRNASAAIEVARGQVSAMMPKGKVIFTSGATEAINMALWGALANVGSDRDTIITLPSEHAAILDSLRYIESYGLIDCNGAHRHFKVVIAPLHSNGLVDIEHLTAMIDDRTALVAAMQVNNEIGVIQPIDHIADIARGNGAILLCDMVQGYGRLPSPQNIDMAALSSHKIYGPKGIGAVWVREGIIMSPMIHGGGQEMGLRSGTLSPALCTGFGKAAQLMQDRYEKDSVHITSLWNAAMPSFSDWTINGDVEKRFKGNLNICFDGLDVARLMSDLRHIAFSAGSACASGSGRSSHVLDAIGLSDVKAKNSIRIGFGRYTKIDDIIVAAQEIDKAAKAQWSENHI